MKASDVVGDRVDRASASADRATALGRTGQEAFQSAVAKLSRKVDGWTSGLEKYAAAERATDRAAVEGLKAPLLGKNPVWMAMRGAWQEASVRLRLAAVLVLALFLLLAPVTLLVLVLGLLVAAIVAGIRAATR